ncbi:hypothetical protein [Maridesulfovibrio ferrireducens]|uniref:hypothetical protein n=1 Tax=Maridesulfovibrio ferrireducens TaxID=246191 RepID=UPI001A34B668|nr:hypothetical protein [Maridesulfovibrio ferrireducens]MBI9112251.1 hypothetical protein [Maridesulfovibrio ferrireducens]
MTELVMMSLKRLLEVNLADLKLEKAGKAELVPFKIYQNAIPAKDTDDEIYPCLVIRWVSSEDDEDGAIETLDILICVYSGEGRTVCESWSNIVSGRIRRLLRDNEFLEDKYKRTGSVIARNPLLDPDARHHTHHVSTVRCSWFYPFPSKPILQED